MQFFNEKSDFINLFSFYLRLIEKIVAVAILPQLFMLQRRGEAETITVRYFCKSSHFPRFIIVVFRHTISSRWAHIVVFTSQTGSTDTQQKDFMTPFRLSLVLSRRSSMPTSFGSI